MQKNNGKVDVFLNIYLLLLTINVKILNFATMERLKNRK